MIDLTKVDYSKFSQPTGGTPGTGTGASPGDIKKGAGESGPHTTPIDGYTTEDNTTTQGSSYQWDMPNDRASWMSPQAYRYGIDQEDWGGTINDPWVKQTWWRDPSHLANIGGQEKGVMYHPYWGWQSTDDIKGFYANAQGPVTWDQFAAAPWTQQSGEDWRQYYDQWTGGSSGGGGGGGSWDYTGGNTNTTLGDTPYFGSPTMPDDWTGQVQNPWEWDQAADVYSQFAAHGYPTQIPEDWRYGSDIARQMAASGMPTDQSAWYQRAKGVAQTDITDAIKQAAEQAGLTGLRWSTPLGRSAQDITGRRMAELGAEWTGRELDAQEQARQRQLSAVSQLFGFGSGAAGLAESAKGRALQGAQGLMGAGQQRTDYSRGLAQDMYGMGTASQANQQGQLNQYLQQISRLFPENSPWLQFAQSVLGSRTGDYAAQQYGQSGMSQLLGLLGPLAWIYGFKKF